MDTDAWVKDLIRGDPAASQQFYDRYGLPVYRYILEKTGDPDRTRVLWKNTFRALMQRLRSSDAPDLPLLWLTALADVELEQDRAADDTDQSRRLSRELMNDPEVTATGPEPAAAAAPPEASPIAPAEAAAVAVPAAAPGPARRRAALAALLIGLIVVAAAGVWAGAGLLMAQEVLPAYDLGYSWFNRHIFHLFPPSS